MTKPLVATRLPAAVRRVLKLVEAAGDSTPRSLGALRAELDLRGLCEIDLDACADNHDRALARTIKQRIDAAARGKTPSLSTRQFWAAVNARRQMRRRRPPVR